ncbi:MAG TPA: thioredoxin domain-containing protein [Gemmatimonadales bacterium]|nr:thioredoxin domain-containing protein [Gemmatimonadales bacterium]
MTRESEPSSAPTRRGTIAGVAAAVVLLGIGIAAVVTRPSDPGTPPGPPSAGPPPAPAGFPVGGDAQADLMLPARTKGDASAPVAIFEVADFQCPACRMFWEQTLPSIEREYVRTGKARLVFINFPIVSLHRNATAAHILAMCAAEQGRFWQMHDLLYAKQQAWADLPDPSTYFLALADSASVARPALQQCQAGGKMQMLVDAETRTSYMAGVKSTPSFIVGGAVLAGAAPIEVWRPILDSIFAVATGATR